MKIRFFLALVVALLPMATHAAFDFESVPPPDGVFMPWYSGETDYLTGFDTGVEPGETCAYDATAGGFTDDEELWCVMETTTCMNGCIINCDGGGDGGNFNNCGPGGVGTYTSGRAIAATEPRIGGWGDGDVICAASINPLQPTIGCSLYHHAPEDVPPTDIPPEATLTANPASIVSGNSSSLTWTCSGSVTSASIDEGIGQVTPAASGTVSTGALTSGKTYTLTCTGPGGTDTDTAQVSVTTGPVVGMCSATHYGCTAGTSISNVDGASAWTWTCQGAGGGADAECMESKPGLVNGMCLATHYGCSAGTSSDNAQSLTQYTWMCRGANGGTDATCSEAKSTEPAASLTCTPPTVNSGESATVAWSSSNTNTCTGTGFSTGNATSGSVSTGALTSTRIYSVTCQGASGTTPATDSCTVTVTGDDDITCDYDYDDTDADGRVDIGEDVHFSASPGNLGSSAYTWDPSDGPAISGEGSDFDYEFDTNGSYNMRVSAAGHGSDICNVSVVSPGCVGAECDCAPEDLTLRATPSRVAREDTSILTYEIPGVEDGVTSCTIRSNKDTSFVRTIIIGSCSVEEGGTVTTHPITTQTIFTLTCDTETATAQVDVLPEIIEI